MRRKVIEQIVRDRLIMKMYLGEEVDFIESIFNDLGFRLRKYFDRDFLSDNQLTYTWKS